MMWPFKWKLSACTYTWCYYLVFQNFTKWNLVEICFRLNLAVKGLSFFARHFTTCFSHYNIFAKICLRMMTFCHQDDAGSCTHEKLVLRNLVLVVVLVLERCKHVQCILTYCEWAGVMLFKEKERSARETKLQASASHISWVFSASAYITQQCRKKEIVLFHL